MKFTKFLSAALIIACCGMPAGAAEIELPRPKAPPTSTDSTPAGPARAEPTVYNYGTADKACTAWTDGCVNCSRGEDDQNQCSNIGPVCQPKAIRCVSRK